MRSIQGILVALAAVAIFGSNGCSDRGSQRTGKEARGDQEPLVVYVTNYPLKYLAERIGGDSADVHFPAPPDEDPAYWMPDSETSVTTPAE
mgnify:CR=1 FL=1